MVTENEEGYSDYLQHFSNVFNGELFMMGFLFAVFAIVLTSLPNPSALLAQLVLFLFAVLLNLIGFVAFASGIQVIYFCRRIPPLSKRLSALNTLIVLVSILQKGTTTWLFALWNLPFLAIASGILWVMFAIADIIFVVRPFQEYRKTVLKKGGIEQ